MPRRSPTRRTTRLPRLLDRVVQQRRAGAPDPNPSEDAGQGDRIAALERRIDQLESLVEGLQDAIHRDSVRRNRSIEELEAKTEPAEIMRSLERHTREKAL
jgi:hypothetical protein